MDTAHALITEYPGREVNLVAGSGTYFLSRDRLLPKWDSDDSGAATPFNGLALEVSDRFDGTNEAAVNEWFRDTYGNHLTPQTGNFLLGLLSESENETIASGLTEVVMDHLRRCRRPRRPNRAGVPQRINQGDTAGRLDRELHGILQATTAAPTSRTFRPAERCCPSIRVP